MKTRTTALAAPIAAAIAGLAAAGAPAAPTLAQDFATLAKECTGAEPALQVAVCTGILLNFKLTRDYRAITYYNRGNGYLKLGQYRFAIADYSRAIHYRPRWSYAYNNRGNANLHLNRYRRAIADFSAAIRLDPRRINAHGNRAIAYERAGNRAAAIRDFRAVLRLRPGDRYATAALKRLGASP